MTVYDGARFLDRFLRSWDETACRVPPDGQLELVLVDDASTDATPEILSRFAAGVRPSNVRLRLLRHGENRGLGASRNTALEVASGDWLAFADADDELLPDWAPRLVAALAAAERAGAGVLAFDARAEWEDAPRAPYAVAWGRPEGPVPGRTLARDVLGATAVGARMWNKVYRRALFDGVRFAWREFEDYPVQMRILPRVETAYALPETLYVYRRRADGLSQYTNPAGGAAALRACCRQAGDETDPVLRAAIRCGLAVMLTDFLFHAGRRLDRDDRTVLARFLRGQLPRLLVSETVGLRAKVKGVLACCSN